MGHLYIYACSGWFFKSLKKALGSWIYPYMLMGHRWIDKKWCREVYTLCEVWKKSEIFWSQKSFLNYAICEYRQSFKFCKVSTYRKKLSIFLPDLHNWGNTKKMIEYTILDLQKSIQLEWKNTHFLFWIEKHYKDITNWRQLSQYHFNFTGNI